MQRLQRGTLPGGTSSEIICTGLTGNTFTAASGNTCMDSDGNPAGDSTSEAACTGITGNSFTGSSCSNNANLNDEKSACEANADPGVGTFTPSKCSDVDGVVLVSDGTGLATSQAICEGTPTFFTFNPAHVDLCRDSEGSMAGDPHKPDNMRRQCHRLCILAGSRQLVPQCRWSGCR